MNYAEVIPREGRQAGFNVPLIGVFSASLPVVTRFNRIAAGVIG